MAAAGAGGDAQGPTSTSGGGAPGGSAGILPTGMSTTPDASSTNLAGLSGDGDVTPGALVSGSGPSFMLHSALGGAGGAGDAAKDSDLGAKRAYKARFQEGIALFNKKPKKGGCAAELGFGGDAAELCCGCAGTRQADAGWHVAGQGA